MAIIVVEAEALYVVNSALHWKGNIRDYIALSWITISAPHIGFCKFKLLLCVSKSTTILKHISLSPAKNV